MTRGFSAGEAVVAATGFFILMLGSSALDGDIAANRRGISHGSEIAIGIMIFGVLLLFLAVRKTFSWWRWW